MIMFSASGGPYSTEKVVFFFKKTCILWAKLSLSPSLAIYIYPIYHPSTKNMTL